jgi:hypothetical protein
VIEERREKRQCLGCTKAAPQTSHRVEGDRFIYGEFPEGIEDSLITRETSKALDDHLPSDSVALVKRKIEKRVLVLSSRDRRQRVTDRPLQRRMLGRRGDKPPKKFLSGGRTCVGRRQRSDRRFHDIGV